MKSTLCFLMFIVTHVVLSQGSNTYDTQNTKKSTSISENGFHFEISPTYSNSEFSDIGSGFFKEKFIMVSSRKVGGLSKIDPNTHEAHKDLYCLDVDKSTGLITRPLSYSRILNTHFSEDQISFSKNEQTVYFTRSSHDNSLEYKIYKSDLEENSNGNWINEIALSINKPGVSIETPFVNHAGNKLYFAANYPDGYGGFDLYVSNIKPDGTLDTPKNLGSEVNTAKDEKYPALSLDDKYLFFASKGHDNLGGYDLFRSKLSNKGIRNPINLGTTINTSADDIAFFIATKRRGYVTSNKSGGIGSYDVYIVSIFEVTQSLTGTVLDAETQIKLPNAQLTLFDDDGLEIAKTISAADGSYKFAVEPNEDYTITTVKEGFVSSQELFSSDHPQDKYVYVKDIPLQTVAPIIENSRIILENIYFDFDKWNIKEESFVTLNKVVKILNDHPEMKLSINAHTDNKGSDAYNLILSKKRAQSTVAYLISKNIDENRLEAHGFGETQPIIDCKNQCSKEDLQANRRIEFMILD
ncbi:OmpA family protein [Tamlana sp. s12]|uniref:OmpA family protein n=1 Tax=Tamlana sp. s12 TaxID=1630406 RepID=UPI0009ED93F7|nr:OmpA family protein [Tamlana sp. s12]QQY83200.1 OmpA family protein [Tamlana sp. s12]